MQERSHEIWTIPLGATVVISLIVSFALVAAGGWNWFASFLQGSGSGWAQAILTGLAIVATGVIARSTEQSNREKEERQRQREFVAAKAFLPSALSELSQYLRQCAPLLKDSWKITKEMSYNSVPAPQPPEQYRAVFQECIRHAPPNVGDYLMGILVKLQILSARMHLVAKELGARNESVYRPIAIENMFRLGELEALIAHLFSFARGEKEFNLRPLNGDDMHTAYLNLDIHSENIHIDKSTNLFTWTIEWLNDPLHQI